MTLQVDARTEFILAVSTARAVPLAWEALTVSYAREPQSD